MKHYCGEDGCRWVTNEEYEILMKQKQNDLQPNLKEIDKKKKSLFMRMIKK